MGLSTLLPFKHALARSGAKREGWSHASASVGDRLTGADAFANRALPRAGPRAAARRFAGSSRRARPSVCEHEAPCARMCFARCVRGARHLTRAVSNPRKVANLLLLGCVYLPVTR